MKTLSKIFGVALLASSLAACGSATNPYANYPYGTGTNGINGAGGCVSLQNGSFSFSGQGQANSYLLLAGNLPMNSTHPGNYGNVVLGTGGLNGGANVIQYPTASGANGSITMTASSFNGPTTISGSIQINPYLLTQYAGYGGGMNTGIPNTTGNPQYNTGLCIQSIALDVVQTIVQTGFNPNYYTGGTMMQGGGMGQINRVLVYLYLNNGTALPPIALPQ